VFWDVIEIGSNTGPRLRSILRQLPSLFAVRHIERTIKPIMYYTSRVENERNRMGGGWNLYFDLAATVLPLRQRQAGPSLIERSLLESMNEHTAVGTGALSSSLVQGGRLN
jgi:hypothetical protein